MPKAIRRLRDWFARRKFNARGLLAIAGVATIAYGLSLIPFWIGPVLAWLAVGVFLLVAAGASQTPPGRAR